MKLLLQARTRIKSNELRLTTKLIQSSRQSAPPDSAMTARGNSYERLLESPFSQTGSHGTITSRQTEKSIRSKGKKRKNRSRKILPKTRSKPSKQSMSTRSSIISSQSSAISSTLVNIDYHSPAKTRKALTRSFLTPYPKPKVPSLKSNSLPGPPRITHGRQFSLKLNPLVADPLLTRSTAIKIRLSHSSVPVGSPPRGRHRLIRQEHRSAHSESSDSFTIEDLAKGLTKLKYKKIVVMSGAGISTSSGIPDFRTPGTGLYDNLKQYRIPEPSAIFDITYFSHDPRPFFTLAKELYPGGHSPNAVHYFIRLLQEKGFLLRNYTQNIDGLERLAGIKPAKLVEAHGSFSTASCAKCHAKHDPEDIRTKIHDDKIPHCKYKYCSGVVKPDIVFFGEDLPQRFHSLSRLDMAQCDLLFIMGTSLEVEPFAGLATLTRFDVPRVLINREPVGPFKYQRRRNNDVMLSGELLEQINELTRLTGWENELGELLKGTGKTDIVNSVNTDSDQTTPRERKGSNATPSSSSEVVDAAAAAESELSRQLNELKLTDKKET